ncbi:hypothetical protein BGZ65_009022, partial [Modicella reniformis]
QILNGEVMRTTEAIEPKMVVLQEEGLIAMSYLYNANPSATDNCSYGSTTLGTTTGTLTMSTKFVLSFVVPLLYLQNFSSFFGIMSDHAPVLIEILRGFRRLNVALDLFAEEHLVPFVEDIMTMEAVAMAIEGAKASHIALGREGDQVFGREFITQAITSHLQTNSSTVVVGNNITIMNMDAGLDAAAGGFWGVKRENSWTSVEWKGQKVVRQVQNAAPMVENLVRCVVGLPIEMREGYVRQWRRGLVKRALMLVKYVKKEGVELAQQLEQQKHMDSFKGEDSTRAPVQSPQVIFRQLGVDPSDLSIVLGTAERIFPSITEFVRVHLGVE